MTPVSRFVGPSSPLRSRDFSLYITSAFASGAALEMALVAVGWQVYDVSRDPLDLGLVGLAMFVPLPVLALPAGHIADRLPRRAILFVSTLVDTAVLAGLLVFTLSGPTSVWPFFLAAFMVGVATAIGAPAGRAMTPSLVREEVLVRALALRSIAHQAAWIGGPAIGGLLFDLAPSLVYGVAVGLSLCSALAVAAIHSSRMGVGTDSPTLESVLAGVRLIRRTPVLFGAISLDLFAVLLGGAVALLPLFARDVLDVGATGLGILRASPAAGALLMAIFLARRPLRRRAGSLLLTVVGVFGVSMVVFGLSQTMWLSALALAVSGAADLVSVVLRQTILPLVTPDELRGRVNAVEMVFISASNELGAFESGVAAALVGAVPAVVIGGVATIVVAVAWTRLFPALARVDRLDALKPS